VDVGLREWKSGRRSQRMRECVLNGYFIILYVTINIVFA
jgi:hypothetical protein